ncbi:hypothetical protein EJO69_03225 [Flaviflexus salsibiostraticola]|uniref:Uridine kinase n=1 Tax=Flaviflexus salsibiostraticola TaxID=1282737 RepID=A0A3S8Z7E0_9ACTO|nr:hypothetical protein [Flaviflexus salsibiostraticola]AZN29429.1 hypothetical protein EJO69_03225 [Flaviflexus salsibiostraticola]
MKRTLANRIADLAPRPAIVTIDGLSGAGKTFLGEALVRELAAGGLHSLLLEVELWAHGWSDLTGAVDRVRRVVADLQEGSATTRTWNWWTESEEPPIVLHPRPVIIVVGCGAGQIPSHLSIWIDADEELRASRVSARDPYDWSEHWDEWARQEQRLLTQWDARAQADVRLTASPSGDLTASCEKSLGE